MAGKHFHSGTFKDRCGCIGQSGDLLKRVTVTESSCIIWKRSCRNVWFYRYGSIAAGGH